MDFNSIDKGADDSYNPGACHFVVLQRFLQCGHFSAVQFRKIRVNGDRVPWPRLQIGLAGGSF
jgi:hypothetical protein